MRLGWKDGGDSDILDGIGDVFETKARQIVRTDNLAVVITYGAVLDRGQQRLQTARRACATVDDGVACAPALGRGVDHALVIFHARKRRHRERCLGHWRQVSRGLSLANDRFNHVRAVECLIHEAQLGQGGVHRCQPRRALPGGFFSELDGFREHLMRQILLILGDSFRSAKTTGETEHGQTTDDLITLCPRFARLRIGQGQGSGSMIERIMWALCGLILVMLRNERAEIVDAIGQAARRNMQPSTTGPPCRGPTS